MDADRDAGQGYFSISICCCSVTKSVPTLFNLRLLCPSLSPRVGSDSCPLGHWYYLTISSSVTPFSFCLQSFPTSGSLSMSQLCIRWPKYLIFSFRISPSNAYSVFISFRIDCFDLLAVQGTLKSLLQHYSILKEILTPAATGVNLEDVMLSEISKSLKDTVPSHYLESSNSYKQKVEWCLPRAAPMERCCLISVEFQFCKWRSSGDLLHNSGNLLSDTGLPRWFSGKESVCQCRRHWLDSWVGKIP